MLPPLCWSSSLYRCVVRQTRKLHKKSSTLPTSVIFTLAQLPGTIHLLSTELQLEEERWSVKA